MMTLQREARALTLITNVTATKQEKVRHVPAEGAPCLAVGVTNFRIQKHDAWGLELNISSGK
jgi:hypothetical protein